MENPIEKAERCYSRARDGNGCAFEDFESQCDLNAAVKFLTKDAPFSRFVDIITLTGPSAWTLCVGTEPSRYWEVLPP